MRVEIVIETANGDEAQALRRAWKAVLESLRIATSTISVQGPVR